jgi:hypothetical protein
MGYVPELWWLTALSDSVGHRLSYAAAAYNVTQSCDKDQQAVLWAAAQPRGTWLCIWRLLSFRISKRATYLDSLLLSFFRGQCGILLKTGHDNFLPVLTHNHTSIVCRVTQPPTMSNELCPNWEGTNRHSASHEITVFCGTLYFLTCSEEKNTSHYSVLPYFFKIPYTSRSFKRFHPFRFTNQN